jgi:hypothetical protein
MKGLALDEPYPQLNPLPNNLKRFLIEYTKHMSSKCVFYNNTLCIAQTTVENGRTNRYEQINGSHSIKLNGRVTNTLPRNTPADRRGLAYFTYDNAEQRLQEHVRSKNAKHTTNEHNVEEFILLSLFNELKDNNIYVKQVNCFNLIL